ncbi:calponin homology domain-containing protein DDB_G0272472-like [Hyalella azteca]|uniref:Calponin homology domain-containing protein DDB_G0272472-like n=1 Tax=Hyalella azteca TaxID=294128 RepID=A0A8B7NFR7_HYAAZ|nr:calponin homology domain-containing protein DDB_G0272472-like [Hyalella azteca]
MSRFRREFSNADDYTQDIDSLEVTKAVDAGATDTRALKNDKGRSRKTFVLKMAKTPLEEQDGPDEDEQVNAGENTGTFHVKQDGAMEGELNKGSPTLPENDERKIVQGAEKDVGDNDDDRTKEQTGSTGSESNENDHLKFSGIVFWEAIILPTPSMDEQILSSQCNEVVKFAPDFSIVLADRREAFAASTLASMINVPTLYKSTHGYRDTQLQERGNISDKNILARQNPNEDLEREVNARRLDDNTRHPLRDKDALRKLERGEFTTGSTGRNERKMEINSAIVQRQEKSRRSGEEGERPARRTEYHGEKDVFPGDVVDGDKDVPKNDVGRHRRSSLEDVNGRHPDQNILDRELKNKDESHRPKLDRAKMFKANDGEYYSEDEENRKNWSKVNYKSPDDRKNINADVAGENDDNFNFRRGNTGGDSILPLPVGLINLHLKSLKPTEDSRTRATFLKDSLRVFTEVVKLQSLIEDKIRHLERVEDSEREQERLQELERERLDKDIHEQLERDRLEQLENERLRQEEQELLEKERLQKQNEIDRLERERLEQLERQRQDREKQKVLENERLQKLYEIERLQQERIDLLENDRLERQRMERLEEERIERQRLEDLQGFDRDRQKFYNQKVVNFENIEPKNEIFTSFGDEEESTGEFQAPNMIGIPGPKNASPDQMGRTSTDSEPMTPLSGIGIANGKPSNIDHTDEISSLAGNHDIYETSIGISGGLENQDSDGALKVEIDDTEEKIRKDEITYAENSFSEKIGSNIVSETETTENNAPNAVLKINHTASAFQVDNENPIQKEVDFRSSDKNNSLLNSYNDTAETYPTVTPTFSSYNVSVGSLESATVSQESAPFNLRQIQRQSRNYRAPLLKRNVEDEIFTKQRYVSSESLDASMLDYLTHQYTSGVIDDSIRTFLSAQPISEFKTQHLPVPSPLINDTKIQENSHEILSKTAKFRHIPRRRKSTDFIDTFSDTCQIPSYETEGKFVLAAGQRSELDKLKTQLLVE